MHVLMWGFDAFWRLRFFSTISHSNFWTSSPLLSTGDMMQLSVFKGCLWENLGSSYMYMDSDWSSKKREAVPGSL